MSFRELRDIIYEFCGNSRHGARVEDFDGAPRSFYMKNLPHVNLSQISKQFGREYKQRQREPPTHVVKELATLDTERMGRLLPRIPAAAKSAKAVIYKLLVYSDDLVDDLEKSLDMVEAWNSDLGGVDHGRVSLEILVLTHSSPPRHLQSLNDLSGLKAQDSSVDRMSRCTIGANVYVEHGSMEECFGRMAERIAKMKLLATWSREEGWQEKDDTTNHRK